MSRPFRARALLPLTLVVGVACQDYNFNPVGHCMVQPGNERVTLSDVSTADVLFIVDDSGSMDAEQTKLASNFDVFIRNLDAANAARATAHREPIDFHIAVTTTSVFWNYDAGTTCSRSQTSSTLLCRTGAGAPVLGPKACGSDADCAGASGTTCRTDCSYLLDPNDTTSRVGLYGESFCCNAADANKTAPLVAEIPCAAEGLTCGTLEHHYDFSGCNRAAGGPKPGVATNGWPYPRGEFVSWNGNPRVLHFDKELYTGGKNRQGFTSDDLKAFFVGGTVAAQPVSGNVLVGTCGSGEEQGLRGAELALQKAIAGQQRDTYSITGQAQWNATSHTASAAAEWPHEKSKLVLVFVGDEDDCSSPDDRSGGVVMTLPTQQQPLDACVYQTSKQLAVQHFVDYFTSLGRPVGAAFIFPAAQTSCSGLSDLGGTCTPSDPTTGNMCCQVDAPCGSAGNCVRDAVSCGAQGAGSRFALAAKGLQAKGADLVVGSICDPNFGALLDQIADIVQPPQTLSLAVRPAEGAITVLRIADKNGVTRLPLCKGPPEPNASGTMPTEAEARAANYDWWFTDTDKTTAPVAVSQHVYINHATGNCEADPGETYSVDFIARMPQTGCTSRAECQTALGGQNENWGCYAPGTQQSTCICCTPGSTEPVCQTTSP